MLIIGLCDILEKFEAATTKISKSEDSTYTSVLPTLRTLKTFVRSDVFAYAPHARELRRKIDDKTKHIYIFYNDFSYEDRKEACDGLNNFRKFLAKQLNSRFSNDNARSLGWTCLLDPRNVEAEKGGGGFWNEGTDDYNKAKHSLANETIRLEAAAQGGGVARFNANEDPASEEEDNKDEDEIFDDILREVSLFTTKRSTTVKEHESVDADQEAVKKEALQRVDHYLLLASSKKWEKGDTLLQWWKRNHQLVDPSIAMVARKWVAIPSNSAPLEREFSIAGRTGSLGLPVGNSHRGTYESQTFMSCNLRSLVNDTNSRSRLENDFILRTRRGRRRDGGSLPEDATVSLGGDGPDNSPPIKRFKYIAGDDLDLSY